MVEKRLYMTPYTYGIIEALGLSGDYVLRF